MDADVYTEHTHTQNPQKNHARTERTMMHVQRGRETPRAHDRERERERERRREGGREGETEGGREGGGRTDGGRGGARAMERARQRERGHANKTKHTRGRLRTFSEPRCHIHVHVYTYTYTHVRVRVLHGLLSTAERKVSFKHQTDTQREALRAVGCRV